MSSPASLDPDTYATVISKLSTSDVLACAQVCTRLRELCVASLQSSHAVEERGTGITGGALRWLALRRLRGVTRIELVDCGELTKASITSAVAGCDSLASLSALRVGPGSWALGHIERLLAVAPPSLASVRLDVLLEMKKDLHEGSHLLAALARPSLRVEKLTLVSDNVSRAAAPSDASGAEAATAALAALDVGSDGDDDAAEEGAEGAPCALGRLCAALLAGGGVEELDASSGALDLPGAASRLLAPLLTARGCLLRRLSARHLDRRSVRTLARALRSNGSLDSLNLSSNMVYGRAASDFAAALAGHASLTALDLDHNPLLDGGGAAVAAVLPSTPIRSLSLCFTGVGDAACDALALALAGDCRLRSLRLSGNRITSSGATSLAASLGKLAHLDLTANVRLDGAATAALAKALPASALRSLRLSGCNVDRKACSRLAAALPLSRLARLDLSSNHFSDGGSDELAWVLGGCGSLTALSLADCNIGDEGADELLEALADADAPPSVRSIDLRWNKLGSTHQGGRGVSGDPRADASSQKQRTAAERQTEHLEHTWQQAKAAGKPQKVYVPKWQREARKAAGGGGGTGPSAVG